MSTGGILGLGAIAGVTIFIGLPVGRMRTLSAQVRSVCSSVFWLGMRCAPTFLTFATDQRQGREW